MSAKTRAQLAAGVAANYPDNTSGDITPLADRTQHTDEVDSSLILAETSLQTITGLVNFIGGLQVAGVDVFGSVVVSVGAEADFPTQDATTITLEAKKIYFLTADISTAKRFVCETGSSITAGNFKGYILTYTGSGVMFTGTDVDFSITLIRISYPSASQAYSFTDSVGGINTFIWNRVQHVSGGKVGTFSNMSFVSFAFGGIFGADDGITISGTDWLIFSINELFISSTDATFKGVDLGSATSPTLEINNLAISAPAGAIGISGLASSGNVPSGSLATVTNCEFLGGMTDLENITADDIRWFFFANTPTADTAPDSLLSLRGNSTETTISSTSTNGSNSVLIAGTWVVERESLMTGTTAGRSTYNAERMAALPVGAVISVEPASGVNKDIGLYLALNGTAIENSGRTVRADSGSPVSVALMWQLSFDEDDYVELFVENQTDTINIIASSGSLRVR